MIYCLCMLFHRMMYSLTENTPEEEGAYGEMVVNSTFRLKAFKNMECYLYKDLYIEDGDNVYQIDHIFIYQKGIFVIETKTINGRIHGDEEHFSWVVQYGQMKQLMPSPIIQNEAHIRALKRIFDGQFDFQSVIVFVRENKPKGCPTYVLNYTEFKDYILSYTPKRELTSEDMMYIKKVLDEFVTRKKELRIKHKKLEVNK